MKINGILARHGIPEQVFSDNGPQFSCTEVANARGFVHSTSSPRYPQSNGLVQKAMQTAKIIIMKATASGRDPYITLPYDAHFGLRKVTCTAVDEQTFEIHSTFDTGSLCTTGPHEPRGYSTALRRDARET